LATRDSLFAGWLRIIQHWPLVVGTAFLAFPTLEFIATQGWATEQGSHGPLVLASGLWLLARMLGQNKAAQQTPATWPAIAAIFVSGGLLVFFRLAAVIELEVYALYALCLSILYSFVGGVLMARLWFPLLYLMFAVPLPDTMIALTTNPLKLWLSRTAVSLLHAADYPIANAGVTIQIGQYELLVAAACAGLNSLITLTAVTLFYVYLSHKSGWKCMLILVAAAVPIAIFANLMRVLILILLTFHAGEAAAQGFLHNFAGMTTFTISLLSIYLLDMLGQQILRRKD